MPQPLPVLSCLKVQLVGASLGLSRCQEGLAAPVRVCVPETRPSQSCCTLKRSPALPPEPALAIPPSTSPATSKPQAGQPVVPGAFGQAHRARAAASLPHSSATSCPTSVPAPSTEALAPAAGPGGRQGRLPAAPWPCSARGWSGCRFPPQTCRQPVAEREAGLGPVLAAPSASILTVLQPSPRTSLFPRAGVWKPTSFLCHGAQPQALQPLCVGASWIPPGCRALCLRQHRAPCSPACPGAAWRQQPTWTR